MPSQDVRAAGTALQHPWVLPHPGALKAQPPSSAGRLFPGTEQEWGRNRHLRGLPPAVTAARHRHRRRFPEPAEPPALPAAGGGYFIFFASWLHISVRAPEPGRWGAGGVGAAVAVARPCVAGSVPTGSLEGAQAAGAAHWGPAGARQPDGPRYFRAGVRDGKAGITPSDVLRMVLGCVIDSGSRAAPGACALARSQATSRVAAQSPTPAAFVVLMTGL